LALDDDIRILSGVSLFEGFTQDQLRLLAFGAETLHLAAGRELYREGEPADSAFIVVSGAVALRRDADGEAVELGEVGTGALLGELALIAETRRPTSAAILADAELMKLNRRLFRRILEEYPDVAAALHGRIVDNFRTMVAEIERLAPHFDG
jgi:CRP-like cAMP-binding protein